MTNLFIADQKAAIKDYVKYSIDDWMIEKLDEMLNEYGVRHFFALPTEEEQETENDEFAVIAMVYYEEEQRITFDLVYLLWCKTVRNIPDERIIKACHSIKR